MPFLDILPVERVRAGLEVAGKPALLDELARLLAIPRGSAKTIRVALADREQQGSTGLGRGVAIPHGRSSEVSTPRAAFVRLAQPLEFEAIDARPVDLVAALIVPAGYTTQHLELLAELAEMFSDGGLTEALRTAVDAPALRAELAEFAANRSRGHAWTD